MKQKMNRALSILLAIVMVCTLMPVFTATAEDAPTYAVGDLIEYGTYPQTRVDETDELAAAAAGAMWKSYGYCSGDATTSHSNSLPQSGDWMQFTDFFCGGEKYRAVQFSAYRPIVADAPATAEKSNLDENGYFTDTVYYFKYEPLTWRVLDPAAGYIMCESLIDAQPYQTVFWQKNVAGGIEFFLGEDSDVYANDYASSTLREWLNGSFYDTAFTAEQKDNITVQSVYNYPYSYSFVQYMSGPTNDKIYFPSYRDAVEPAYGFGDDNVREDVKKTAQGTDYAKCQGLTVYSGGKADGNSAWWLRASGCAATYELTADAVGYVSSGSNINRTNYGVRPACILSELIPDSTVSDILYSAVHEHTPGEPVRENVQSATCTDGESYEEVVYCAYCTYEFSRTHVTLPSPGHGSKGYDVSSAPSTCTVRGYQMTVCIACGEIVDSQTYEIDPDNHRWGEWEVVKQATYEEEGLMRRTCLNDPEHVEERIIPRYEEDENGNPTQKIREFIEQVEDYIKGVIDWILRLFNFFGR